MSTSLLLETTEAFEPSTVWWFVNNVTKLGISHAHARQTCCLLESPRITRIIDTIMYLPPTPNIFAHRMLLFPVVLRIDFLQTHDGIISFPNNQLYLTNSSPNPAALPINANLIYNTYAPPTNTLPPYHPHSHITLSPDQPYHVINTAPVPYHPERIP